MGVFFFEKWKGTEHRNIYEHFKLFRDTTTKKHVDRKYIIMTSVWTFMFSCILEVVQIVGGCCCPDGCICCLPTAINVESPRICRPRCYRHPQKTVGSYDDMMFNSMKSMKGSPLDLNCMT